MNTAEALEFLRSHQPMPDDANLDEATIRRYEEVRRHFIASPDDRCIELFLNSFGQGDGFGVYQLVDEVMRVHDHDVVRAAIEDAISSDQIGVRSWALQLAAEFGDHSFIPALTQVLTNSSDDDDRFWAAVTLTRVSDPRRDSDLIHSLADRESDEDVRKELLRSFDK